MSRTESPKNQPVSLFDMTPWRPIDSEKVKAVAAEFGLQDTQDFQDKVFGWSVQYRQNRLWHRDIRSKADEIKLYEQVVAKLEKAEEALVAAFGGNANPLNYLPLGPQQKTELVEHIDQLKRAGIITSYRQVPIERFEAQTIFSGIVLLAACTKELIRRGEEWRDNPPPDLYGEGENTSLPPFRNKDRTDLLCAIRAFWKTHKPSESCALNFDRAGEEGPANRNPRNDYGRFSVDCAQLVDPGLTVRVIKDVLEEVIEDEDEA